MLNLQRLHGISMLGRFPLLSSHRHVHENELHTELTRCRRHGCLSFRCRFISTGMYIIHSVCLQAAPRWTASCIPISSRHLARSISRGGRQLTPASLLCYVRYSTACGVRQLISHLHHRRALARTHCAILCPPVHGLLPSEAVTKNVPARNPQVHSNLIRFIAWQSNLQPGCTPFASRGACMVVTEPYDFWWTLDHGTGLRVGLWAVGAAAWLQLAAGWQQVGSSCGGLSFPVRSDDVRR